MWELVGGSSSDDSSNPPVDTTAPEAPTDLEVSEDGSTVTGTGEPGSTVVIKDPAGNIIGEGVVGEDGTFDVELTTPQLDGENLDVSLTDKAGNTSDSGTATAPDTTAPSAPTDITVGNGDAFITEDEIDADGNIDVVVGLPADAVAGDTVVVNGVEQELTEDDISADKATVKIPAPAEGESLEVTATIKDPAGNVSDALTENVGSTDTTAPTGLLGEAEIVIDANNDGIIDIAEKGTSTQTDVVIELVEGSGIEVGDILTLTSNTGQTIAPIPITQDMITAGSVTFTGVDLPSTNGKSLEVEASLSDSAGNVSTDTAASDQATLNTNLPVAPVTQDKTVGMYEDGKGFTGDDPTAANAVNGDNANLNRPSITIDVDTLQQRDTTAFDIYLRKDNGTFELLDANEYSVSTNTDGSYTYQTLMARANGTYDLVATPKGEAPNTDLGQNIASKTTSIEVGYTFSQDDFSFTDANNDNLAAVIITSLPASGQLLLNGEAVAVNDSIPAGNIGGLLFVPNADYSGSPTFNFKVQDKGDITEGGANTSEEATITIDVVAVADGPVVEYTYQSPVTSEALGALRGDGVNMQIQNDNLKLNENAKGTKFFNFKDPERVDYMPGIIDTTPLSVQSNQTVDSLIIGSFRDYEARRYDGLIYLEAGTYTFSAENSNGLVSVDETVLLNIGGERVLENNEWRNESNAGYDTSSLVVQEAGFYTLDMYFMNFAGNGGLPDLTISGGKFDNTSLTNNTADNNGVKLFTSVEAINAEIASKLGNDYQLTNLLDSKDGMNGHYVVTQLNQGESNSWIKLSDLSDQLISVDLLDKDGSEKLLNKDGLEIPQGGESVLLSGLPVGAVIRDNSNNSVEITSDTQQIDITGWVRDQIEVFVPPSYVSDKLPINIIATSKDSNGDLQQGQTSLIVNDSSLYTDTSTSGEANITAGSGNNTMYGGSGADILDGGAGNDILIGGSGGDVRGGGFEYWDFSSAGWSATNSTASGDSPDWVIMQPDGETKADYRKQLDMGSWQVGGQLADYKDEAGTYDDVQYNKIELNKPSKRDYGDVTGAGSWVLDTTADRNNQLDIWQDVETAPGEAYELTLVISRNGESSINIMWGGAIIGQVEPGRMDANSANNVIMYNGFEATVTRDDRGTGGLGGRDDDIVTIKIDVVGDKDAAFTNLRLQSNAQDKDGHELGKAIFDVSLTAKEADGDDTLIGGYGDDLIYGQGGDDILYGDLKPENGEAVDGSIGNDVFVFSMLKDNGNDIIKDFSIANDKLYMIDLLDAFQGSGQYNATTNPHVTRYPGADNDGDLQSTSKSDDNITIKDLLNVDGNSGQYIELSANGDGDLVLTLTGRGTSKGTVTLEGIKYGVDDNDTSTYGSVEDLLGANGHQQILYVTTDSFNTGVDNDLTTLTNIMNTPYFGV